MSAPTPTVSPELKVLMRKLRLGQLIDTLPERLALAKSHNLAHVEFLEQLFCDEVTRRDGGHEKVPVGGHGNSPRTATRSPRVWPLNSPLVGIAPLLGP